MSELGRGGYHWQDQALVDRWDERLKPHESKRTVAFNAMLQHLPADRETPLRVLDIGAGDGTVAGFVLDQYPNASALLIDFSKPMMEKGREKLARFGLRFRYLEWDMNEGDWPSAAAGPFDAVVSSAAIHHLEDERKDWLACQVVERLAPGGAYANYDLFRDPGAVFSEAEVHDQTCSTMDDALKALARAGFANLVVTQREQRSDPRTETALLVALV